MKCSRRPLADIFEPFRQGDAAETHLGLGLGLAIVRQLVALHGGTITVKSPGERGGGTFIVPRVPTPPSD